MIIEHKGANIFHLFILFSILIQRLMKFEESEADSLDFQSGRQKTFQVIVLRDNREWPTAAAYDFRCSAFKETEIDPLEEVRHEVTGNGDQDLMNNLLRRVSNLQARVHQLTRLRHLDDMEASRTVHDCHKKNRRKFVEMDRHYKCPKCSKAYGSETSLKHHQKLKHSSREAIKSIDE